MSTYRHKDNEEGRAVRSMSGDGRSLWQEFQTEYRRAKRRDEALQTLAFVVLVLGTFIALAIGCSREARAGGWGTLPADAYRVCFVDDGQWDCLYRVSDFNTLRFCPGTGDPLNQPSPPGLLLVGFTDGMTGEFTLVRTQPYEWRQYQPSQDWIVVGMPQQGSFADGFEDPAHGLVCDEYRT